jgi:hypothetical protein
MCPCPERWLVTRCALRARDRVSLRGPRYALRASYAIRAGRTSHVPVCLSSASLGVAYVACVGVPERCLVTRYALRARDRVSLRGASLRVTRYVPVTVRGASLSVTCLVRTYVRCARAVPRYALRARAYVACVHVLERCLVTRYALRVTCPCP